MNNLILDIGSETIKYIDKNQNMYYINNFLIENENDNNYSLDNSYFSANYKFDYYFLEKDNILEKFNQVINKLFNKIHIKDELKETNLIVCTNDNCIDLYDFLFEKFSFPNICVMNSSIGGLYSSGKTSGYILDLGFEKSRFLPFYESCLVNNFATYTNLGGYQIDFYSEELIKVKDYNFNQLEIINVKKENNKINNKKLENFYLPDSKSLHHDELFGELLFDPNLYNLEVLSISDMINNTLNQVEDTKIINNYLKDIIITGGLSNFINIKNRIKNEIKHKINIIKLNDGIYNNINGIKEIYELPGLIDFYIQISEYEEHGKQIFNKKGNN